MSKILIGISCLSVTLWQCLQLIDNFNSKETLRKTSDKFLDDDIMTPVIIICSDPPQQDFDQNMINWMDGVRPMLSILKIKTMFKVSKSIHTG